MALHSENSQCIFFFCFCWWCAFESKVSILGGLCSMCGRMRAVTWRRSCRQTLTKSLRCSYPKSLMQIPEFGRSLCTGSGHSFAGRYVLCHVERIRQKWFVILICLVWTGQINVT